METEKARARTALKAGERLGLDPQAILALVLKYGPQAWAMLQDILALFPKKS